MFASSSMTAMDVTLRFYRSARRLSFATIAARSFPKAAPPTPQREQILITGGTGNDSQARGSHHSSDTGRRRRPGHAGRGEKRHAPAQDKSTGRVRRGADRGDRRRSPRARTHSSWRSHAAISQSRIDMRRSGLRISASGRFRGRYAADEDRQSRHRGRDQRKGRREENVREGKERREEGVAADAG